MFITPEQSLNFARFDVFIRPNSNINGDFIAGRHVEIYNTTSGKACSNTYYLYPKIGSYTVLHPGEYKNITIGNYSAVGEGFKTLGMHDFERLTTSGCTYLSHPTVDRFKHKMSFNGFTPVVLGHNVWLGSNVIVKHGLLIGTGAAIEDGTVVTKHVPPFAVVAGAPGKIIGLRYPVSLVERMQRCEWYRYDWQGVELDWTNLDNCLSVMEQYVSEKKVPELTQGMVATHLDTQPIFSPMAWSLERYLKLMYNTHDFEQILQLPDIKAKTLQF